MHDLGVGNAKLFEDVVDHLLRRRRREGENDRAAEVFDDRPEGHVFRPEVVAPLADAMGLIDNEQVDWRTDAGEREIQDRQVARGSCR